jgi:hypothetical protein
MKKYLLSIFLLFFIFSPTITLADAFKPATLFLSLPTVIIREPVYTKARADFLFSRGYQLETKALGATITTIDGSDKLKDSRVVINTNFTNLNTDKMEWSSWYATTSAPQLTTLSNLVTVGTITSGTWNGTTITVSRGGTGSTTLSANNVLLGNGTSAIINVPAGTSGQFLTASTTGNPPYWASASVNQGDNYTWTGTHTFNGTTTANNLLISSSTITQWPSASTSIATKGYVDDYASCISTATTSQYFWTKNTTVVTVSGETPTKKKEIVVWCEGTITALIETYHNGGTGVPQARLYKNDVAFGSTYGVNGGGYGTSTIQNIPVTRGDKIATYLWEQSDVAGDAYLRDFQIFAERTSSPYWILNP